MSKVNDRGVPMLAIYAQSALTIVFISTATFESILVFSGFILGVNSLFAVMGVFVLRFRNRDVDEVSYLTWGYPLTPIIYIAITTWTITFISINRPMEAAVGGGIVCVGLIVYLLSQRMQVAEDVKKV